MGFIEWCRRRIGIAQDSEVDLREHDRRFHPHGWKEGDKCRLRETLAKEDSADDLAGAVNGKVSPAMDSEYMEAVENGDTETATRMVREAVAKAMPNVLKGEDGLPLIVYHGTNSKKKGKFPFTVFNTTEMGDNTVYSETPNGSYFTSNIKYADGVANYQARRNNKNRGRKPAVASFFLNKPQEIFTSETEYVISNPTQIKSADPVTYDDDNKPIPLSKRFDLTNPDIRY